MSKPISKIAVQCPHCGGEQLEPELAKSTYCRRCSQYFAVTHTSGSRAASPPRPVEKARPSFAAPAENVPAEKTLPVSGIKQRFGELIASKPKARVANCFECSASHEVSTTATSATCKACGAYIDLQDYKINGSFSRNIKTRGSVYLGSKGDLSSSKIICSEATLHGKMRGNLHCDGGVTIRVQGKLFGTVEATGPVIIEKGSDVQFSRPLKAVSLEVHGKMSGHVASDTHVTISKTGLLEGDVTAAGFTVEKGGLYQGELTITPRQPAAAAPDPKPDEAAEPTKPRLGAPLLGPGQTPAHG